MVGCPVTAHNMKHILYRYEIEDCDVGRRGWGVGGAISYSGLSYNGKIQNTRPWKSTTFILQPNHGHNPEPIPTISHHANCSLRSVLTLPTHHPYKSRNRSCNRLNCSVTNWRGGEREQYKITMSQKLKTKELRAQATTRP